MALAGFFLVHPFISNRLYCSWKQELTPSLLFFFFSFFPPYWGFILMGLKLLYLSGEVGTAYCTFHRINPPKVLIALSSHWLCLNSCFVRIGPHTTAQVRLPSVSVISKSIWNMNKRPQQEKYSAGSLGVLVHLLHFNFCWQEFPFLHLPIEKEKGAGGRKLDSVSAKASW